MSQEFTVGRASDLPPGTHRVFEVSGRQIGIFNIAGKFYALPNACFHQNGPLCRGIVDGTWTASAETDFRWEWSYDKELIICPWHSLEFHIPTGRCLSQPRRKLPNYEVRVDGDDLKVVL